MSVQRASAVRYDAANLMASLLKSTSAVSAMTLLSRISGFARDTLLAILFGAGAGMDAFLVAFKIPNFMRRLFSEGAFSQAFVPVLGETKTRGTSQDVRDLVSVVSGTLGGVLLVITAIGVIAAPLVILLFAPGFLKDPGKFQLSIDLLRFTFPYLLFISLTALATGVLNTYGRFAVPAFTPVLLNLCLIAAALWLAPRFDEPVMALAIGVFIAGAAQLVFQFPFLRQLGMLSRPRWAWRDSRVRKILNLMLPVLFGSSVAQVALLLDTIIASFLVTGSVSWLYYADRLMEFPLGIFSIAIATVILPALSARHAEASVEHFSQTLDWALRLLFLVVVPAAVGLFVLAGPLTTTLFQYRSFTPQDALMTRYALMAYSLGLMTFSLVKVLLPGYFARQDTRTPVRYGVISLLIGMCMSVSFALGLQAMGWIAPHVGLAVATSLGALINAALLYRGLRQAAVYQPGAGWKRFAGQIFLATLVMGAMLWLLAGDLSVWLEWDVADRASHLASLIFGGAALYVLVLLACGLRPRHLSAPGY